MKIVFLMLAGLALTSCSHVEERQSEISKAAMIPPLYTNSVAHQLSDKPYSDTLQVTINGETILTGKVYLKITDHTGGTLFWDSFPATALIDHEGLINPENDEKHIRNQLNNFFDLDHFSTSSKLMTELSTLPDSTRRVWKAIQGDPKRVYFSYRSSKSGISEVAYSKDLKKVVSLKDYKTFD
jgi:hypothetical protein